MIKSFVKSAFRNVKRQKLYTLINVFGLSLGIACCILIMLFVQHELSYDRFHENVNQIFRINEIRKGPNGEKTIEAYIPMPVAPTLEAEFPEVLGTARCMTGGGTVSYGEKIYSESFLFIDPNFLKCSAFH